MDLVGKWFDPRSGAQRRHESVMAEMAEKRVVLLGENHDRYEVHRWQAAVCASLLARRERIAVGFEMFPRRVRPVLDEWVAGKLSVDAFLEKVEWKTVWGSAPDLYLPLFHFCREFAVPMLAINCRRDLVSRVGKEGWEAIPLEERDGVSPARPTSLAHREHLLRLTGGGPAYMKGKSADAPEFDRFVRAQQTWDRAFACNIAAHLAAHPDSLVVGIIGRGHMEYGFGTPDQLEDLGIADVGLLLTQHVDRNAAIPEELPDRPIADAIFGLRAE